MSFFAAQVRKSAPKPSGNYTSVYSISSYTQSVISSNFMLSSGTTDGSSTPSLIFDHSPCNEPKTNAFSNELKKLYHDISHLETKFLAYSEEPQQENCIVIKGGPSTEADDAEKARWKNLIENHKRYAQLCFPLWLVTSQLFFLVFPR